MEAAFDYNFPYTQLFPPPTYFFKVTLSLHGHAVEITVKTVLVGVFKDALTSELAAEKHCIHKLLTWN